MFHFLFPQTSIQRRFKTGAYSLRQIFQFKRVTPNSNLRLANRMIDSTIGLNGLAPYPKDNDYLLTVLVQRILFFCCCLSVLLSKSKRL